ncbi:MAG: hypothetical protein JWQ64_724 [Subtercola sp.]|nr:hypothetical protein [Subtercola sp.]
MKTRWAPIFAPHSREPSVANRRTKGLVAGLAVVTALVTALALSGCSGQASPTPAPSTSVGTPSPSVTATLTPPATPTTSPATTTPPASTTPAGDQAAAARADVVTACQTWQSSLSQDSTTFPVTQAKALTQAQSAASGDPQWQPVVDTMQTLVSLIGDNSSSGIATGQQAFTVLGNECQTVGVVVNGG